MTDVDLSLGTLNVHATPEAVDDDHLRQYSSVLQSDIQGVLRRNEPTRFGQYRFGVKLWVDPARVVQRIQLYQSTGDSARDGAVSLALRGLVVSCQTPPNMPQPVRVVVTVRSSQ